MADHDAVELSEALRVPWSLSGSLSGSVSKVLGGLLTVAVGGLAAHMLSNEDRREK